MKATRTNRKRAQRLHVRMDDEVMGWLRKAAAKKRTTVSEMARQVVYEAFDARHAK